MSDASAAPLSIALVGATGLVGRAVMRAGIGRTDFRLTALSRREQKMPQGAKMDMIVAEPANWPDLFEAVRPTALICALGTTRKKVGGDEEAFRAIDHDLVLDVARGAVEHGVERMVYVSSIGADPHSKNLYLRVKGETERDLNKVGFRRLDILRPGLLRGARQDDLRPAEQLGKIVSPITDLFLHGHMRDYRSIPADILAQAALGFAQRKARGRFAHTHDQIRRAAREFVEMAAE